MRSHLQISLAVLLAVLGATVTQAQAPLRVGEVRPYHAETPHPYPFGLEERSVVWTDTIVSPGAAFIRVRFTGLALAAGDFVTVSSPDGAQSWTYTGRGPYGNGVVWSFAIDGEEAIVRLYGGRANGFGYRIDAIGHGTRPFAPTPEVVCGTDGREDVACHLPEIASAQTPVARLLYVCQGAFLCACTGWLVEGSAADTLMTNNHCLSRQSEVDTLQATFNFQRSACGGTTNNSTTNYNGGTFLKTNNVDRRGSKEGLDYTLLTLQGNPQSTWGALQATAAGTSPGNLLWFIQHPGGNEKEVGYWEDAAKTTRCHVDLVNQTYGRSAAGSQIAYACDSEGGSSGSPIIDPGTGRVIALHHFGGVDNNPCLNSGTSMTDICADAGSLLNCVGGGGSGETCEPPLLPKGAACSDDSQCCSNNCKGKPGAKTCK